MSWVNDPTKNKMIGAFTYKGISSLEYELVCKSVKRPLLPPLKSNVMQIPGSSNVYDPGGAFYDLMGVTMKIQYIGKDFYEMQIRASQIASWLTGGSWSKLLITGSPGYYVAKIEEEIEVTFTTDMFAEADVAFVCLPFLYGNGTEYVPDNSIPFIDS